MSSSGLIGNVGGGYRAAAGHWRPVLAVVLPLLAPAVLAVAVLDLLAGRDQMVIVNRIAVDGGGSDVARLVIFVVFWLLAFPAAAIVAAGAVRGHAVRPVKALAAALPIVPVLALGLIAALGVTFLLLRMTAGAAGELGPGIAFVLVLVVALAGGLLTSRVLTGVISHRLGAGWGLTRGRVGSTAGAFLLGGIVVPAVLADLSARVPLAAARPLVDAVLLTGTVAVQAGILAHLSRRPAADAFVAGLAGGPPRRWWIPAAATVAALLVPVGFAVLNPLEVATVQSHGNVPSGSAEVAWPAGKHPVIATMTGAWFCDDDACDRYVARDGGPAVMAGQGTAGISADGSSVVKATLGGSQASGGPFIHYSLCTRDGCPEAWLAVRGSAKEAFGWPELAAAVAPDRAIWFALAMPSDDEKPGEPSYRITFIRCADVKCAKPQRHPMGTVKRVPDDETASEFVVAGGRPEIRLTIKADGRPEAVLSTGAVSCDPVTCAQRSSMEIHDPQPLGNVWSTMSTGQVVSLGRGVVHLAGGVLPLEGSVTEPFFGGLAVTTSDVYATAAERQPRPGFHVSVGNSDPGDEVVSLRHVLWRCNFAAGCRRQPLDSFDAFSGRELIAVGVDGRVLLLREDRLLLVTLPDRATPR